MVPEEEYEIFSDDEISIDVPISPNSLTTFKGSIISKQQKFGSISSSTDSLNSFQVEPDTYSCLDEDKSSNEITDGYTIENERHKIVEAVERTEKTDNMAGKHTSAKEMHIQIHDESETNEAITTSGMRTHNTDKTHRNNAKVPEQRISKSQDMVLINSGYKKRQKKEIINPKKIFVNENSDPESSRRKMTRLYSNSGTVASQRCESEQRTDDSDDTNTSDVGDTVGDDSNTLSESIPRSEDSMNKLSSSNEHLEELDEDDDVFKDLMQHVEGSEPEIAKEMLKETDEGPKENNMSNDDNEKLSNIKNHSYYKTHASQKGSTVKPDPILQKEVSVSITNSVPNTSVLQNVTSEPAMDNNDKETKDEHKNHDSERGISVSNILLDSKNISLTPTIELTTEKGEKTGKRVRSEQLPANTDNELVKSFDTVASPVSPSWSLKNTSKKGMVNKHRGSLKLLITKDTPDSGGESDLSPISDIEYDYNKRRGSHLKIKLEGRRRQRLSISESEPSRSPIEMKSDENESSHGNIFALSSEALLDKRQKIKKVSLTNYSEKTPTASPTSTRPVSTIVNISDTKSSFSLTDTAKSKKEDEKSDTFEYPKSFQSAECRKVKNINSLSAELTAIYNSTSTEEINTLDNKQKSGQPINTAMAVSVPKPKEEDYFEAYHLLKSCNQEDTTQSFVTDINQMIVNRRKQIMSNTRGSQQDFNSDSISNNADRDNKDGNEKNCETKSLLLPNRNETGNCQIKASEKCTIEHDRLSYNCEHRQLSLRQNGHKNNEINEPNSSIERSPSETKQTKLKDLRKRQSYEKLHERKVLSVTFVPNPQGVKPETPKRSKSCLISSGNSQVNDLSICTKKEKNAKDSTSLHFKNRYVKQKLSSAKSRKENAGSENLKMSARILRSREEQNEMAGNMYREMSARLHRTQSALTDTARLRSIRKLLKLPDDNEEKPEQNKSYDQETNLIIQDIIEGIVLNACSLGTRKWQATMKRHRCTTFDDDGEEVLCCLFQTSSNDVDPSTFMCDVIDPADVCPITRKHEHLISNIVRISSHVSRKFEPEDELMANLPISHWYVEPWEQLVVRQQDGNGYWKDASNQTSDVVKIDDAGKVYYGVRHFLLQPCTLAVVSRPRVTSVIMEKHNMVVNAVTDDKVKMHVFASEERKSISMQVVPVSQSLLTEFCETKDNKKACIIVASSPLLQIFVSHNEPESLAFDAPYVSVLPHRPVVKPPVHRSSSPYLRTSDQGSRDGSSQSLLSPNTSSSESPRRSSPPRRLSDAAPVTRGDSNQLAFHLAQLDDDDEVRVKLLGSNDSKTIDIVTGKIEEHSESEAETVKFSVYDKAARLIALQTKGSLEYSDVRKVTRSFVNFLVKHKVTLRISQDPRNVYSILFTAMVDHPHREENHHFKQTYKYFTTNYHKELQIYEGDIVAISFRGNVDVPDREKLIYSFHGYRGIKRHFDIQVSNPMSQRSLQTYHGALQVFTLKSPRYSGIDRSLAPCNKNGWELSAEFPLLLPKYLKSTPVIINKAPVSLRFHEPLTVDFIRTICSELVNEWTHFAKALGISHARIQAIKQQHRNQVSDKVLMDIMINWMKTQRISQDKVTPLINALRLCNRPKLASELAQRYSAQKVSRTKTTKDKSLEKAISLIRKSSSVIARWRQLLHHLCQNEGSHVVDVTKEIDEKYNDEATKCQHALNHWKTNETAPSVWKLVDALRASRCDIVADTIVTMESKRKQPDAK